MIVRRFYIGLFGHTKLWRGAVSTRDYKTSDNFYDNSTEDENKLLARVEHEANASEPIKKHHKQEKLIRVAIVGVPNAGKSTLINALAEHRVS